MGWNTARVTLTPPRWHQTVKKVSRMRNGVAYDSYVAYPHVIRDCGASALQVTKLRDELAKLGAVLERVSDKLLEFSSQGVDVSAFVEGGEVIEIQLSFTLTEDSPAFVQIWRLFVARLCRVLGVELWDPVSRSKTDIAGFVRVLTSTQAWSDFQTTYSWGEIE